MTSPIRPVLRWAGSKRRLLHVLRAHAPSKFTRYVEPFCGSVCLYLDLNPETALLGDNNDDLIQFYRRVQHRPAHIGKLASSMPRTEAFYYGLRSLDPQSLSADDRAARFLYLNRFCFNGVYRTNKAGQFNVPMGKHMGALPTIEEITQFGRAIRKAEFLSADFQTVLDQSKKGDFIYLDPPYAGASRDRGEYGVNAFKESDIDRLVLSCEKASKRGAMLLISYADYPAIIDKMTNWNVHQLTVLRSVSGFSKGRGVANEILISNFK